MKRSVRVMPPHRPDERHLRAVVAQMRRLGRPRLRGVLRGRTIYLIEGSHRHEAARHLGIQPIITLCAENEIVSASARLRWRAGRIADEFKGCVGRRARYVNANSVDNLPKGFFSE